MKRKAVIGLFFVSLAAGCSSTGHERRYGVREEAPKHALSPGYRAQQQFATTTLRDSWTLGGNKVDVDLLLPQGNGSFPLILYLPGLGEPAEAGAAWRQAWAEAGYAVLSVQPVAVGKVIWSSPSARAGEFRMIAKEQFSPTMLGKRLATLRDAMGEVKHRHDQGGTLFAHIDLARIAVAGFDLGAQTAMSVAGENVTRQGPFMLSNNIKCVVALSPYSDFSGPGFAQRFSSVHMPVLSVTSLDDTDPYGLVTEALIRRAPFQYMPPGQKYLLSFAYAPHSLIAGAESPVGMEGQSRNNESSSAQEDGRERRRGGRRGYGGEGGSRSGLGSPAVSEEAWKDQVLRIQSVTTAFLDRTVKDDPIAAEWMDRDARRWIGDSADLLTK